jgi:hypothetical protein
VREQKSGRGSKRGRELLTLAGKLVDQVTAIDFCVPDDTGSLAIAATLVPQVIDLIGQAADFLEEVQDFYDQDLGSVDEQLEKIASLDSIGAQISSAIAAQEIRDLAFVSNVQIRGCQPRLEAAVKSNSLVNMVASCDDAVSRLRKGLSPIEVGISEYEGVSPPQREWADMSLLLQARRLYGELRRELQALGDPDDYELEPRFAGLHERLADLRASEIYIHLRISDRVQIRALQKRISLWLREENRDFRKGQIMWTELITFVNLLAQINHRQELHEHDRQVISQIYRALYADAKPPRVIPKEVIEELYTLEGLDDELDNLILQGSSRNPQDWREPVARLWQMNEEPDDQTLAITSI